MRILRQADGNFYCPKSMFGPLQHFGHLIKGVIRKGTSTLIALTFLRLESASNRTAHPKAACSESAGLWQASGTTLTRPSLRYPIQLPLRCYTETVHFAISGICLTLGNQVLICFLVMSGNDLTLGGPLQLLQSLSALEPSWMIPS